MSTELTVPIDPITKAQMQVLTQRTPKEWIRTRQGPGGRKLSFVPHAKICEQLNLAFGWQWDYEVIEQWMVPDAVCPDEVFVKAVLTVHLPNGKDIKKTQFGSVAVEKFKSSGKPVSVGDSLKAASSDALRKCASLLGFALDLYCPDDDLLGEPIVEGEVKENGQLHEAPKVFKSVDEALEWGMGHSHNGQPVFPDKATAQQAYDAAKAAYMQLCQQQNAKGTAAGMRECWLAKVKERLN